jgi:hypothetical protein
VLAGATTDVQHPAADHAGLGQGEERRLRAANVPRGPLPSAELIGLLPVRVAVVVVWNRVRHDGLQRTRSERIETLCLRVDVM